MPLPAPVVPLVEACSTLFNNTLYTFSASAFQSLPLTRGAKWSKLSMGVPVTGASCVQATPQNSSSPASLYIVGGATVSNDGSYSGLQRYSFEDGKWETIKPSTAVTLNRVYHNAVYLNESASILVYAGSQDGNKVPSSQTFTISTLPPYNVLAYESIAPPAVAPLLMQWTESKAVMIGGGSTNTKVMVFSPDGGWVDSGATLEQPLEKNITAVTAVVQDGNDGSKNLYTFDMSVSPNTVNRTVLVDADGNPVVGAKPIISRSLERRNVLDSTQENVNQFVKRDSLTLTNWPEYNNTLAPKATRTSYSIAKDQSGLVVMSGGSDDDILCMFKARDNCWVNATEKLSSKPVQNILGTTSSTPTTSLLSSTTPSQTASGTATATNDPSAAGKAETLKILGAVLGSVVGVALILVIVLLILRCKRNRRRFIEAGHQRRASGLEGEKNPMDFQDRGMDYPDHLNGFQSHSRQQESQGSFSSMAILMGRVGNGNKRGMLGRGNGSNGSDASSVFNKKYKTAISNPIPQSAPAPYIGMSTRDEKGVSFAPAIAAAALAPAARPRASAAARRGSTRRSSGWNRYWSGGSAMNILGFGSRRTTGYSDHTDTNSQYSERDTRTQVSQPSAVVPPLNLGGPPRLSRVASNSPTISGHNTSFPLREGMAGKIERPGSAVSDASSYDDRRDAFSSGVPESIRDENSWTPFGSNDWQSGAPSVAYTESNYDTSTLPRHGQITSQHAPMPKFPTPPADRHKQGQPSSDMSWLNLGAGDRR
jgi:hypothetical protein